MLLRVAGAAEPAEKKPANDITDERIYDAHEIIDESLRAGRSRGNYGTVIACWSRLDAHKRYRFTELMSKRRLAKPDAWKRPHWVIMLLWYSLRGAYLDEGMSTLAARRPATVAAALSIPTAESTVSQNVSPPSASELHKFMCLSYEYYRLSAGLPKPAVSLRKQQVTAAIAGIAHSRGGMVALAEAMALDMHRPDEALPQMIHAAAQLRNLSLAEARDCLDERDRILASVERGMRVGGGAEPEPQCTVDALSGDILMREPGIHNTNLGHLLAAVASGARQARAAVHYREQAQAQAECGVQQGLGQVWLEEEEKSAVPGDCGAAAGAGDDGEMGSEPGAVLLSESDRILQQLGGAAPLDAPVLAAVASRVPLGVVGVRSSEEELLVLGLQSQHLQSDSPALLAPALREAREAAIEASSGSNIGSGAPCTAKREAAQLVMLYSLAAAWRAHIVLCVAQQHAIEGEPLPQPPLIPPAEEASDEANIQHAYQCLRHATAALVTSESPRQEDLEQLVHLWSDVAAAARLLTEGTGPLLDLHHRSQDASTEGEGEGFKEVHAHSEDEVALLGVLRRGDVAETTEFMSRSELWPAPAPPECTQPLFQRESARWAWESQVRALDESTALHGLSGPLLHCVNAAKQAKYDFSQVCSIAATGAMTTGNDAAAAALALSAGLQFWRTRQSSGGGHIDNVLSMLQSQLGDVLDALADQRQDLLAMELAATASLLAGSGHGQGPGGEGAEERGVDECAEVYVSARKVLSRAAERYGGHWGLKRLDEEESMRIGPEVPLPQITQAAAPAELRCIGYGQDYLLPVLFCKNPANYSKQAKAVLLGMFGISGDLNAPDAGTPDRSWLCTPEALDTSIGALCKALRPEAAYQLVHLLRGLVVPRPAALVALAASLASAGQTDAALIAASQAQALCFSALYTHDKLKSGEWSKFHAAAHPSDILTEGAADSSVLALIRNGDKPGDYQGPSVPGLGQLHEPALRRVGAAAWQSLAEQLPESTKVELGHELQRLLPARGHADARHRSLALELLANKVHHGGRASGGTAEEEVDRSSVQQGMLGSSIKARSYAGISLAVCGASVVHPWHLEQQSVSPDWASSLHLPRQGHHIALDHESMAGRAVELDGPVAPRRDSVAEANASFALGLRAVARHSLLPAVAARARAESLQHAPKVWAAARHEANGAVVSLATRMKASLHGLVRTDHSRQRSRKKLGKRRGSKQGERGHASKVKNPEDSQCSSRSASEPTSGLGEPKQDSKPSVRVVFRQ